MTTLYRVQLKTRLGRQFVARCVTYEEAIEIAAEWTNPTAGTKATIQQEPNA